MGAVASGFQGLLFAGMNTAILAYIGDRLHSNYNVNIQLLPRLLVFHFALSFVLGLVFMESIGVRLDPVHGPIVGPIGTFVAAWMAMYILAIVVLLTSEYVLMVPLCFAVAYTFGFAKAVNYNPATVQMFIAICALLFGLVILLTPSDFMDEAADELGSFFDIGKSSLPATYLAGKGGLFAHPVAPISFVGFGAYLLMWSQIPRSMVREGA